MLKKSLLGILLVGFIGVLVVFAIIRTVERTGNVAEARGLGHGRGAGTETNLAEAEADFATVAQTAWPGGGRNGQASDTVERLYPNYEVVPEDWDTYAGTVVQAPETGEELIIETDDGDQVVIGTGPDSLVDQGLNLEAGEQVQVQGYWESGEFRAAQVTRLRDGATVSLRDELGRPTWAGRGRSAQAGSGGGYAADGAVESVGEGAGTGKAEVDQWLTLSGTVESVDSSALVVHTTGGQQIVLENRGWWFAQDQGFTAEDDDEVSVSGFYEGDDFEVGQIDNLTNGKTVTIREESGRPRWAGGGRRGA